MFDILINIFDIPLILVLICLSFCSIFLIRNVYNVFLSLFISVLIIIFSTTTILVQQVFLGEFIVVGIFFMCCILFFVFNLNKIKFDEDLFDIENNIYKKTVLVISLIILFSITALNFLKIDNEKDSLLKQNIANTYLIKNNTQNEINYDEYKENIALLNQNKIFQKLTHIIMFYVCVIIIFYFFNKIKEEDER